MFFVLVLLFVIFVFILGILFKRQGRQAQNGQLGEKLVRKELSRLNRDDYLSLHDQLLPRNDGKTAQIDHVVSSIYGVFVIETKDYQGTIYGSERQGKWTQVLGPRKFEMFNPIHQNFGHVKALQELLQEFGEIKMFNLVVFTQRAKLKVEMSENADSEVVNLSQLLSTIAAYKQPVLTREQALQIADRIENAHLDGRKARKKHVADIQADHAVRAEKIKAGLCPKCGSPLVDRVGKFGSFKGCSGFPACRYHVKQKSS
jgi:hypothetical protein